MTAFIPAASWTHNLESDKKQEHDFSNLLPEFRYAVLREHRTLTDYCEVSYGECREKGPHRNDDNAVCQEGDNMATSQTRTAESDANSALAFKFWLARCFRDGSPEEDLFRAVCANSMKSDMTKNRSVCKQAPSKCGHHN
jgi:hypothetical protein